MKTKTCPDCGTTYTAWTDDKRYCGGLDCQQTTPAPQTMRIVGLRRGNYRRSPLDIARPASVA